MENRKEKESLVMWQEAIESSTGILLMLIEMEEAIWRVAWADFGIS